MSSKGSIEVSILYTKTQDIPLERLNYNWLGACIKQFNHIIRLNCSKFGFNLIWAGKTFKNTF